MSTSISAGVGARVPGPETVSHTAHQSQQQEQAKKESAAPAEAIAFTTPVIKVDNTTGLALLVVRDGSTGEELDQYPSRKVVEEYQRVQQGTSPEPRSNGDAGASLAANATVPPAPVAAPPVSPATGDARTTAPSAPSGGGVAAVTN